MLVKLDHFPKIFGVKIKKGLKQLTQLIAPEITPKHRPIRQKLLGDPDNTVASSGGPWSLSGGPGADRCKWSDEASINGQKYMGGISPRNKWSYWPPKTGFWVHLVPNNFFASIQKVSYKIQQQKHRAPVRKTKNPRRFRKEKNKLLDASSNIHPSLEPLTFRPWGPAF